MARIHSVLAPDVLISKFIKFPWWLSNENLQQQLQNNLIKLFYFDLELCKFRIHGRPFLVLYISLYLL